MESTACPGAEVCIRTLHTQHKLCRGIAATGALPPPACCCCMLLLGHVAQLRHVQHQPTRKAHPARHRNDTATLAQPAS